MESGMWQLHGRLKEDVNGGSGQRSVDARRPSLGFPLGTALVLLIVLGISALFSCCYHWEKIRTLHGRNTSSSFSDSTVPAPQVFQDNLPLPIDAVSTPSFKALDIQQNRSLPVVMPGDEMPKFIAWPSPRGSPPLLKK